MISREKFLEVTVRDMLVERSKNSKDFFQLSGEEIVKLATDAYRALVDAHLSDLVPSRSPSEFIESITAQLDNMSPRSRCTLLAFFQERYGAMGERR